METQTCFLCFSSTFKALFEKIPILGRSHMILLFKSAHEIPRIFLSELSADLPDGQNGIAQKRFGIPETDFLEQLRKRSAEQIFEIEGAVRYSVMKMSGQSL